MPHLDDTHEGFRTLRNDVYSVYEILLRIGL